MKTSPCLPPHKAHRWRLGPRIEPRKLLGLCKHCGSTRYFDPGVDSQFNKDGSLDGDSERHWYLKR